MRKINIAIDGPSGAGKSTISDILATKLGYVHLDTGAMYRALAYKCLNKNIDVNVEDKAVEVINNMDLVMTNDGKVILDGEDISDKIRTAEISMAASTVSKHKKVRQALVSVQQRITSGGGYIVDGRDICEVVLPFAEVKVYLTASAEARAQRRVLQNKELGLDADYDEILKDINQRDYQDMHRDNSPLHKADDATVVDSSEIDIDETVEVIMKLVEEKIK